MNWKRVLWGVAAAARTDQEAREHIAWADALLTTEQRSRKKIAARSDPVGNI